MVIEGLRAIMNASCLTLMLLGTTIGIVCGAIPGLTATMAVALCLPNLALCRWNFWRIDIRNSSKHPRNTIISVYHFRWSADEQTRKGGESARSSARFLLIRNTFFRNDYDFYSSKLGKASIEIWTL